jgi:hypothetical protein
MKELLPCPHCGSEDTKYSYFVDNVGEGIQCQDCGYRAYEDSCNKRHIPWISIKKQEPPRMETILFCNEYQVGMGYIPHRLDGSVLPSSSSYTECPFKSPITHWMPLPPLPEDNS